MPKERPAAEVRRARVLMVDDQPIARKGLVPTIAFAYFSGVKSIRAQSLMTAALTGVIVFNLLLIVVLDNTFDGYLRVTPEPLREILERIDAIESS